MGKDRAPDSSRNLPIRWSITMNPRACVCVGGWGEGYLETRRTTGSEEPDGRRTRIKLENEMQGIIFGTSGEGETS